MEKTLGLLKAGETAKVKKINLTGEMKRRLLDLGVINGTKIKCLFKSPSGDPAAYEIRGAVIALRYEDSALIDMEPVDKRGENRYGTDSSVGGKIGK